MDTPKWTVLYNSPSIHNWLSRARDFFDDENNAIRRYNQLSGMGLVPTKRPYHKSDESYLVGKQQ